jgi:hypothetical protein
MTAGAVPDAEATGTPWAAIPGSAASLRAAADEYAATARDLLEASRAVEGLTPGAWRGGAALAFGAAREQLTERLLDAGRCYDSAAVALARHATVLNWVEAEAAEACTDYARSAACTRHTAAGPTAGQRAAIARWEAAAASADRSADATAQTLREATDRAPRGRGFWNEAGRTWAHFWRGAWDPIEDVATLVWRQNTVRAMVDPGGWLRDTEALASGWRAEVRSPSTLAKDLVDWDTWSTDPARAAGRLVPQVVLALATAGVGGAAVKGAASAASIAGEVTAGRAATTVASAAAEARTAEAAAATASGRTAATGLVDAPASNASLRDALVLEVETRSPYPLKASEATGRWEEFLGPGDHTNIHPRTGLADPDRLVSADGRRSIRFGDHEMQSTPSNFHFHEESWTFDDAAGVWNLQNALVRVPFPKGAW